MTGLVRKVAQAAAEVAEVGRLLRQAHAHAARQARGPAAAARQAEVNAAVEEWRRLCLGTRRLLDNLPAAVGKSRLS